MTDKNTYIDLESGALYPNAEAALKAKHEKEEKEREEKNPPFIQLTKGIGPEALARVSEKSPTAIAVLMFFFENMDDYNTIMVSQQVIAETLKKSRQAIANAVKVLEDENIIGIGKVGQANVYLINPRVAWQNGYKKRNIINLKGNILLGKNENEELFKRFNNLENNGILRKDNLTTKIVTEK